MLCTDGGFPEPMETPPYAPVMHEMIEVLQLGIFVYHLATCWWT